MGFSARQPERVRHINAPPALYPYCQCIDVMISAFRIFQTLPQWVSRPHRQQTENPVQRLFPLLVEASTSEESSEVHREGNRWVNRKVVYYNLDAAISVGYRVNSKRGTQFRIWANGIMKDYLLKGYIINHRVTNIENRLSEHDQKFDLLIKTNLLPAEGIFYDGQIFDAYKFAADVIRSAKRSIILVDNYIDEGVLTLLSKRNNHVRGTIFTSSVSKQLKMDIHCFNKQYPAIEVKRFSKSHDRFLIIDRAIVYHLGASLKDLGKKWFAFSRIGIDANELIERLDSADNV